jgi:hypothetical protein
MPSIFSLPRLAKALVDAPEGRGMAGTPHYPLKLIQIQHHLPMRMRAIVIIYLSSISEAWKNLPRI